MSRLPQISGRNLVKKLEKLGYKVVRQTGSHIRMWHSFDKSKKPLTIPDHKTVSKGVLRKIIRDLKINLGEFKKLK